MYYNCVTMYLEITNGGNMKSVDKILEKLKELEIQIESSGIMDLSIEEVNEFETKDAIKIHHVKHLHFKLQEYKQKLSEKGE
jgi:hypothetical protein